MSTSTSALEPFNAVIEAKEIWASAFRANWGLIMTPPDVSTSVQWGDWGGSDCTSPMNGYGCSNRILTDTGWVEYGEIYICSESDMQGIYNAGWASHEGLATDPHLAYLQGTIAHEIGHVIGYGSGGVQHPSDCGCILMASSHYHMQNCIVNGDPNPPARANFTPTDNDWLFLAYDPVVSTGLVLGQADVDCGKLVAELSVPVDGYYEIRVLDRAEVELCRVEALAVNGVAVVDCYIGDSSSESSSRDLSLVVREIGGQQIGLVALDGSEYDMGCLSGSWELHMSKPIVGHSRTTISARGPSGTVSIETVEIYNVRGQRVVRIRNPLRARTIVWNGVDSSARQVASGVYYVRAAVDGKILTGRILLLN